MPGKVPHDVHSDKEAVHKIVHNRFDSDAGRFKSELEVLVDKEKAAEAAKNGPIKNLGMSYPDNLTEDWTGTKYVHPKGKD